MPYSINTIKNIRISILIFACLLGCMTAHACSCSNLKIVNAFSFSEYVGVVEFQSVNKIENSQGYYESSYTLFKLYKGKGTPKIFINSLEGSSCGFVPTLNKKYLILGEKINGRLEISFCSAMQVPDYKKMEILDQIVEAKIPKKISSDLYQSTKDTIDSNLFPKTLEEIFIYEVSLDSDLTIVKLSPLNNLAKESFNDKIKRELLNKIKFRRLYENKTFQKEKINSIIILNWEVNYDSEMVFGATRLIP